MKYKLRAECSHDVARFISATHQHLSELKMTRMKNIPDVELEFETEFPLNKVITSLKVVPDSHVMWQTVKPIDEYTGERKI